MEDKAPIVGALVADGDVDPLTAIGTRRFDLPVDS